MTPEETEKRLLELSRDNSYVYHLLSFLRLPECTEKEALQAYKATVIALAEANEELKQRCKELLALTPPRPGVIPIRLVTVEEIRKMYPREEN